MISFATEFPIERTHTAEDFVGAVRSWILGSPHTNLTPADLAGLVPFGEWAGGKGNETVETVGMTSTNEQACGVRYKRHDGNLEWLTAVVFSRMDADSWVSIRVSCESTHPSARLPSAKKPVLIRTLLNTLGGSSDGELRVGRYPVRLDNADIEIAARLIRGDSGCRLPIVYVSAGFQGTYGVDVERLASDLEGLAHVVVEPNRAFSLRLKIEVDSENVYGGTVGVYWPEGGGRRSFFLRTGFDSPDELHRAILEEIRTALTNRRALDRCTWASVQELASRRAIAELKTSGSRELNKYVETFDKELAAKAERLEDADREIARLHKELRILEARVASGTGSLLRAGAEQDLYPDEIVQIVRDAVVDHRSRVPADSRRMHVLDAVLAANPPTGGQSARMREDLKNLLRDSRGMEQKTRRGLEEMGFSISDDGKHHKLVFQGDDRYSFTLPKSGSDHRGGLNAASDIGRLLF